MANVMRGRDAVFGALAKCFVTIDNRRLNFMQMIDFEAKMDKEKKEIPILGQTGKGNKAAGWKGKFKGKAHYNNSEFRQLLLRYKNSGEDVYFEIQVVNEDPTSSVGRQSVILTGCNLDGGVLAKFDADGEYLDEDVEGTFEDWNMPETFTNLAGM